MFLGFCENVLYLFVFERSHLVRNVKPKKFIVFLRGIEPVTDVIFLKWSLRNLNKIQSSKYSRTWFFLAGWKRIETSLRYIVSEF